jgi:hypothetical protein
MTWLAQNWDGILAVINMIGLMVFGRQNHLTNKRMED